MSRDDVLSVINKKDMLELIYMYCIDMGKPEISVRGFIAMLAKDDMFNSLRNRAEFSFKGYCFNYALRYYTDKFNIILLLNKNNNFIKAF